MGCQYKSRILILVADDDEDDRLLVGEALREWNPAVEIRFAANGQILIDYLESCHANGTSLEKPCPDLILLDLNMPEKNGREALREIRTHDRLKSIPIIIFSTSSDQEDIDFCHAQGANSYICKSSDFQRLVDKMRSLGVYWFSTACLPGISSSSVRSVPAE
jgi:CheY-like chemotaxis protein